MYKIKQVPEDFRVKEISNMALGKKGKYAYFVLKKRNYTTEKALRTISSYLHIDRKGFGYAGNKDKKAVTTQLCSVFGGIRNIKLKDIETEIVGCGDEPVSLGDLESNEFEIMIRNLNNDDLRLLKKNYEKLKKNKFKIINFFDEQRFSKNNVDVGKELIKGNFREAISLILENKGECEERIKEYLKDRPNDFIGALRIIPKKILHLYVHAFQSKLWNETANQLKHSRQNIRIPLVGFGTEFSNKKIESIMNDLMEKESIKQRDFIIKQIPELSSEGSERDLFTKIKNLKISESEKDELNKGKKKIKICFQLNKGAYATAAVKVLLHKFC